MSNDALNYRWHMDPADQKETTSLTQTLSKSRELVTTNASSMHITWHIMYTAIIANTQGRKSNVLSENFHHGTF